MAKAIAAVFTADDRGFKAVVSGSAQSMAAFGRQVRQTQGAIRHASGAVLSMKAGFARLEGALAGYVSVRAAASFFHHLVTEQFEAMETTADLAKQFGIATSRACDSLCSFFCGVGQNISGAVGPETLPAGILAFPRGA